MPSSPDLVVGSREGARFGFASLTPWLMLLPVAVSLGAVSLYPILRGVWLSLTNTSLITQENDFVGLGNYVMLAGDAQFWNAWSHTVYFTLVSTVAETVLGLAMALLLVERFPGRSLVRAAMLVPWAMPTVVTSKMFGWLFDGQYGVVNWALRSLGLIEENVNWYGSIDHAMTTIIIADVWKTTPFMALLLLAGLQTIPSSLTEAARMDGARYWLTFWYVKLPLLASTLLIAGMFRALDAFRVFDLVYVLTGAVRRTRPRHCRHFPTRRSFRHFSSVTARRWRPRCSSPRR